MQAIFKFCTTKNGQNTQQQKGEKMKKEQAMPNFIKMEESMLDFWNTNNCFDKLVQKNKDSGKYFRFLDGPITANNKMGVHHAWNRSLKRYNAQIQSNAWIWCTLSMRI